MNLIIIGNGFDLAHGMKTRYSRFRRFLHDNYELNWAKIKRCEEYPELPSVQTGHHGEKIVDDEVLVTLMGWLLAQCKGSGERWEHFEDTLGNLDIETILDENTEFCGDDNYFHEQQNYEDVAMSICSAIERFPELFEEWIDTVKIADAPRAAVAAMLNADTLFLSFNYTETLEVLYGIARNKICYIHGRRNAGEQLLVGHGNDTREFKVELGAEIPIYSIQQALRKNTSYAMQTHTSFFDGLATQNITDIYSYGFSFSDVDMVYITRICESIDTSAIVWHLNSYEGKITRNRYKKKVLLCGFNGEFTTF